MALSIINELDLDRELQHYLRHTKYSRAQYNQPFTLSRYSHHIAYPILHVPTKEQTATQILKWWRDFERKDLDFEHMNVDDVIQTYNQTEMSSQISVNGRIDLYNKSPSR
eukprot:439361_1